MKATGNFEAARDVDPMVVLSDKTRAHIDHWLAKFPPERKRSAVLQGLQNGRRRCGIRIGGRPMERPKSFFQTIPGQKNKADPADRQPEGKRMPCEDRSHYNKLNGVTWLF